MNCLFNLTKVGLDFSYIFSFTPYCRGVRFSLCKMGACIINTALIMKHQFRLMKLYICLNYHRAPVKVIKQQYENISALCIPEMFPDCAAHTRSYYVYMHCSTIVLLMPVNYSCSCCGDCSTDMIKLEMPAST